MTGEKLVLVFKDGTRFEWNTSSMVDAKRAISAQKKHGDPTEIIGDGKTADLLRRKYQQISSGTYESDVLGTASELSGVAKEKLEADFKNTTNRLRRPHILGH